MTRIKPSYANDFAGRGESASPNLWTGLVGAWHPSLGPTGLTLFDQSGYGNHGTLTNMDPATDWVMTEKGWALDFDGNDDYVDCGNNPSLNFGNFTLAVLARWDTGAGSSVDKIVDKNKDASAGWTFRVSDANKIGFWEPTNGWTDSNALSWSNGIWYSTVVTYDGSTLVFYRDGIAAGSSSVTIGTTTSDEHLKIGGAGLSQFPQPFDGQIAQVLIYIRALASNEIMQLHLDPAALFRYPTVPPQMDGLPAVSDRPGRGVLTGGRM